MDYREAWAFLDSLQFFKIKLGLTSMNAFLGDIGQARQAFPCVHVAGTNGKGSMAATLLAILSQAGYRVGLYSSPHLSSVRERFRLNNGFISERDFALLATRIRDVLNGREITYFEFTTVLALLWFAREKVDLAILEVGMGGRLDATNVITPLVSVITNVSMDHEAYLGNTLARIAMEKAGIVKPGVPVVSGVANDESRLAVKAACEEKKAPLYLLGRDFRAEMQSSGWRYQRLGGGTLSNLALPLKGRHQAANAALALTVLDLLAGRYPVAEHDIRQGLARVRWPGRLEYFCLTRSDEEAVDKPFGNTMTCPREAVEQERSWRRFLLDGAHNPAGVAALAAALETDFVYNRLIMVWGSMADKDMAATMSIMAPVCDVFLVTRPEGERSASPEQLREIAPKSYQDKVIPVPSVFEALQRAWTLAEPSDLIGVAGSLYLVGEARKLLLGEEVA